MVTGQTLLGIVVSLAVTGCGVHYWERPGGTAQEFEFDRDSLACVEEARARKVNLDPEDIYRGCMRGRKWRRMQAPVGGARQYRGG